MNFIELVTELIPYVYINQCPRLFNEYELKFIKKREHAIIALLKSQAKSHFVLQDLYHLLTIPYCYSVEKQACYRYALTCPSEDEDNEEDYPSNQPDVYQILDNCDLTEAMMDLDNYASGSHPW